MISKKVVALCAAFGVAFTGTSLAIPASADPVAETYAIVGSDTLEDVVNAIVSGNTLGSVRSKTQGSTMGSFDATGSPCITTKTGLERMARPNGSTDGVAALSRSIDGTVFKSAYVGATCDRNTTAPNLPTTAGNLTTILDYVDLARSSSTPSGSKLYSGTAGTYTTPTLAYIPFGRDAFAYAYHSASTATGIGGGFTSAQMKAFYECTTRTFGGQTITPVIPQAGSGTRSAWLTAIGSSETGLLTVSEAGGCVVEGQEHDGRTLTGANSIMPMSASRWVAMENGLSVQKKGSAVLGSLVSGQEPVTVVNGVTIPNETYYNDLTWGRETWIVVSFNRITLGAPGYDANLAAVLDSSVSSSLANTSTARNTSAGSIKLKYGIIPPKSGTTVLRANLLANG